MLLSILNKAIIAIPDTTYADIISTEIEAAQYKYTFFDFIYEYRYPLAIGGLTIFIIFCLLINTTRIKQKSLKRVEENEKKLASITNNINGGVVVMRPDVGLEISFANDGFLQLLGSTREDFEDKSMGSYLTYVFKEDLPIVRNLMDKDVMPGEKITMTLRIKKKDGTFVPTLFNGTLSEKADGERELYCVIMDMTVQSQLIEKLNMEKQRTDLILDKSDSIIYEVDLKSHEIITSRNMKEKFGWTFPEKLIDGSRNEISAMWKIRNEDMETLLSSTDIMTKEKRDVSCTVRLMGRDGNYYWNQINQYPICNKKGELICVIGNILNVDQEVQEKERLEKLAMTDALTGLYKQQAFTALAKEILEKEPDVESAMLFIDLDHFKQVNDKLGHMTGDEAIKDAAHKLQLIFSNYDLLSRFGGDEFCIFVRNISSETLIRKLDWTLEKMKETYSLKGKEVTVTSSIGVVLTKDWGSCYENLIEGADKALYQAKANGRNQYYFGNKQ